MPTHPSILYVGDRHAAEFAPVAEWLAQRDAEFEPNVATAVARIEAGFAPAVIVVSQPWPGHISSGQIDSLRSAAPLARIVSLLGSWLEGEARTGKPWPAVWRTYWHQWLPRFVEQIDRLAAGQESVWSLPATAGDDQRLTQLTISSAAPQNAANRGLIAIFAPNRETAETLADACRREKWQTVWLKNTSEAIPAGVELILFDTRNLNAVELALISHLKSSGVPVLVLAAFPRAHDLELLQSQGVAAVISKPYLHFELIYQIRQYAGGAVPIRHFPVRLPKPPISPYYD